MTSAHRAIVFAMFAAAAHAQVSTNASLSGKYFFRQVALQTSGGTTVSQTLSAFGTLTFDGNGNFTVQAQTVIRYQSSRAPLRQRNVHREPEAGSLP